MERLRELLKDLDRMQDESEWPQIKEGLNNALARIKLTNERYENEKAAQIIAQFEQHAQVIISDKNVKLAKELTSAIHSLDFAMVREEIGLWISYIRGYDEEFDMHEWKNRSAARQLINEAKENIATNPSKEVLEEIVWKLFKLLPEGTDVIIESIDDKKLKTTI